MYSYQALEICRRLADHYDEAITLDTIATVHHRLGDHERAAAHYQQALDIHRQIGHRDGEAQTLVRLGDSRHQAGELDAARTAWRQALEILDKPGHAGAEPVRDRLNDATAWPSR